MTYFLQSVLGKKEDEVIFSTGIARLEKTTGHSGVDTRLIADIIQKAHVVMRNLSLDTRDTTGHELYLALITSVKRGVSEELLADTDYVLLELDGTIISFNVVDVINSAHHELPYKKQVISYGQRSLRGELVGRYINHARTDEATTIDVAFSIGLLPEQDKWYTYLKHNHNQRGRNLKELTE